MVSGADVGNRIGPVVGQRAGVDAMSTPKFKDDSAARELFGPAYEGIPKSVFAVVSYYLADACSDEGVGAGAALKRLREEIDALDGQIIDPAQAKRALAALAKAVQP